MRIVFSALLAATLLIPGSASARDALLRHFEGRWGIPGSLGSCEGESATIRFSSDGSEMQLSYEEPTPGPDDVPRTEFHYRVSGVAGKSVRMRLEGETRTTDAGELVVWDLVRISGDAYCWHRADWEPDHCTPPRIRCESLLDDFEQKMRARTVDALGLMRRGAFEEAAALFGLPSRMPDSERDDELRRLAHSLGIVVRELGTPARWSEVMQDQREPRELVNVSVGPSHVLVAQEYDDFFLAFFRVDFAQAGPGYFRAVFDRRGRIVRTTFSLPREHSERMAEIGAILLRETAHEL